MSEVETGSTNQPDPMKQFRELRDAYLEIWSKNFIDAVNTEGYAQASGAALNTYMNVSGPYKEAAEQAMLRTLQQLNMPTSVDFAGLAGRFTNMEMQIDNMDAKLDRVEKLLTDALALAAAEPGTSSGSNAPAGRASQSAKAAPQSKKAGRPRLATKATPKKQSALRASGTPKRTKTAKPLRRNARKGTA